MHNYELFKMEPTETISEIFTRFIDITTGLKSLDRVYSNSDLVDKVLRSLPDKWDPKVTAIQEAKDLNSLPLEELLGSLITHELTMKRRNDEEGKKKKTIALKAAVESDNVEENEARTSDEEFGDDDMALVIRRFRRFMGKGRSRFRKKYLAKGEPSKEKEKVKDKDKEQLPIYYECKKPGHYKPDCPLLKKIHKKSKKKKAMMATWSDSEESSSNEEEEQPKTANICLMELDDEVCSNTDFTYDELNTAFYELLGEYRKAGIKIRTLKFDNRILLEEKNKALEEKNLLQSELKNISETQNTLHYEGKIKELEEENTNLKNEIEKLRPLVDKLTLSSNKLELILKNQRESNSKAGIGYKSIYKEKLPATNNMVSNASASNIFASNRSSKDNIKYFKCDKNGHKSFECRSKKTSKIKVKRIWVPKGTTATNLKGPKKAWVP